VSWSPGPRAAARRHSSRTSSRPSRRRAPPFSVLRHLPDQRPAAAPSGPSLALLDDFELTAAGHPTIAATLQRLTDSHPRVAVVAVVQAAELLPEDCRRLFVHTFHVPLPTPADRERILRRLLANVDLTAEDAPTDGGDPTPGPAGASPDALLALLAAKSVGFAGKDLLRLCRAAYIAAVRRSPPTTDRGKVAVHLGDLLAAMRSIQAVPLAGLGDPVTPIARDAFAGYEGPRRKCAQLLRWFAEQHAAGAAPSDDRGRLVQSLAGSSGILLYRPSGCGKSHLVRWLAGAAPCSWVSLKGSGVLSKYVGEAERALRQTFRRAAGVAPCVVVLDEIDALTRSRRLAAAEDDGGSTRQVLSTLLCEMDGIEGRRGVLVIGCSNRPKLIDAALLRQGRLEHLVYLGPPSTDERLSILRQRCGGAPLAADVDLHALAARTDGLSGAGLAALCREASLASFREGRTVAPVRQAHFEAALATVQPIPPSELSLHFAGFGRQ